MRFQEIENDSLELLLDTVCNVFGGIVLMAILVVISTQASADRIPGPKPEDMDRALRLRAQRFELERLVGRAEDLARQRDVLRDTLADGTSADSRKLLEAHERFVKAAAQAQKDLSEMRQQKEDSRKSNLLASADLSGLEQEQQKVRQEIESYKLRLRAQSRRLPDRVRLPHRQRATGGARYYVVKGGKAYPLEDVRWFGEPHVSGHCLVFPDSGGLGVSARIRPKENAGYPAPVNGKGGESFWASLKGYGTERHYVVFFVYDDSDSFESFQQLKQLVLGRGFAFVALPKDPDATNIVVFPVDAHETE